MMPTFQAAPIELWEEDIYLDFTALPCYCHDTKSPLKRSHAGLNIVNTFNVFVRKEWLLCGFPIVKHSKHTAPRDKGSRLHPNVVVPLQCETPSCASMAITDALVLSDEEMFEFQCSEAETEEPYEICTFVSGRTISNFCWMYSTIFCCKYVCT